MTTDDALWMAWRGVQGDDQIWGANEFPGEDGILRWSNTAVLGQGAFNSSHGPALCQIMSAPIAAQTVLMSWKGEGTDQHIFSAVLNNEGQTPAPVSPIGGPGGLFLTIGRPAIIQPESDVTLLVWQNPENNLVWATQNNGQKWTDPRPVGAQASRGPALVALGNTIYMVWRAVNSEQIMWARFVNGNWTSIQPVPVVSGGANTSDVPALITIDNGLFMAWKGVQNDDPRIWTASYRPGGIWSAPAPAVPLSGGINTSHGPALALLDNQGLFMAWKGEYGDQRIWSSSLNSAGQWSTPIVINPGINSSASPALASYGVYYQ